MSDTEKSIGLIGFMGVGKTVVGRRLSTALNREFLDTDAIIEMTTGKTISDIFARDGEKHFREIESSVVRDVCSNYCAVISFGGGAPLSESNSAIIKESTLVVLLRSSLDTLVSRISKNTKRPLVFGTVIDLRERITALYAARKGIYAGLADLIVDTDSRTADQTVADIIRRLRQ
jgi:shikimate kinase